MAASIYNIVDKPGYKQKELEMLDKAWDSENTYIISLVAWGGVGKSTLVNKWLERMKADNFRGALSCLLTIRCLIFIIQFSARMVLTTIIFILFLWNQKENR
jgi:GTPase SAR1 family protein